MSPTSAECTWLAPRDLASALSAAAQPGAMFRAGGIDLGERLQQGLDRPRVVIDLHRLSELAQVRESGDGLLVGALSTLAQLAKDRRVPRALALAAAKAGSAEVRGRATLGGNLVQRPRCWYFRSQRFQCLRKGGEGCPAIEGQHEAHAVFDNARCAMVHPSATATALVALGASARLRSLARERTVPLEEFFVSPGDDPARENVLDPGELILELLVPRWSASAYIKQTPPGAFDWTLAEAAAAVRLEGGVVREARLVLGAAAPVPWRARAAERALLGKPLDAQAIGAAASLSIREATPLPRNRAKVSLLAEAARAALCAAGAAA